ncbi:MAG: hypothetical protein PVI91_12595 [Gammaproteobacteria bacterium]|jgi:hypothetical protein
MSTATLVMGIGLFAIPELSHAVPPGGLPDTTSPPPFGLPPGPPFGTGVGNGHGKGKGNGRAVASISYHCLGVAKQLDAQNSPYSLLADRIVADLAGQQATLEGAATSDMVAYGDPAALPTHMAGASIRTAGLSLQSFDTCGATAESQLNSVVVGVNEAAPETSGAAYVTFIVTFNGLRLETHAAAGSGGMFSASTETTLKVLGLQEESFTVSATGELVEAPPGLTVTDLSVDDHYVYEISGAERIPGRLYFGKGVRNILKTTFTAAGEVSTVEADGSTMAAGFASAETLNTISVQIVSENPSISFSFVPVE